MKKSVLIHWILAVLAMSNNVQASPCKVALKNTEIINSEFYIDFTPSVEKIFQQHGYGVVPHGADYFFVTKNFITTGTNYFRLQQVHIEFTFTGPNFKKQFHEMKNCMTVSCTGSRYLEALKGTLKKFNQQLQNCQ